MNKVKLNIFFKFQKIKKNSFFNILSIKIQGSMFMFKKNVFFSKNLIK